MGSEKFSHPHTNEIVVWLARLLWGTVFFLIDGDKIAYSTAGFYSEIFTKGLFL